MQNAYRSTKCSSGSPHRERRRREEDVSSGFSAALHRTPPPPPPALLRRLGVKEPTGVGKTVSNVADCSIIVDLTVQLNDQRPWPKTDHYVFRARSDGHLAIKFISNRVTDSFP
ncbi:unnamed protein product [Euphydryas editha]|uniref:Uncharacterized protein n=1 Tax=Euphydryas editha TaxID=104508 RepID=A0AAU9V9H8_EUPED|nr:unnamed protein product [Euphydryas editha]